MPNRSYLNEPNKKKKRKKNEELRVKNFTDKKEVNSQTATIVKK
jgi:hypothetical protein